MMMIHCWWYAVLFWYGNCSDDDAVWCCSVLDMPDHDGDDTMTRAGGCYCELVRCTLLMLRLGDDAALWLCRWCTTTTPTPRAVNRTLMHFVDAYAEFTTLLMCYFTRYCYCIVNCCRPDDTPVTCIVLNATFYTHSVDDDYYYWWWWAFALHDCSVLRYFDVGVLLLLRWCGVNYYRPGDDWWLLVMWYYLLMGGISFGECRYAFTPWYVTWWWDWLLTLHTLVRYITRCGYTLCSPLYYCWNYWYTQFRWCDSDAILPELVVHYGVTLWKILPLRHFVALMQLFIYINWWLVWLSDWLLTVFTFGVLGIDGCWLVLIDCVMMSWWSVIGWLFARCVMMVLIGVIRLMIDTLITFAILRHGWLLLRLLVAIC